MGRGGRCRLVQQRSVTDRLTPKTNRQILIPSAFRLCHSLQNYILNSDILKNYGVV